VADLFHITTLEDWAGAVRTGAITMSTRGVTLAEEGFVHCSYDAQVGATAARFFGDLDEVVVLRIDPDRVTSPIVAEDLYGAGEDFPHVYGPINVDAVTDVRVTSPLEV
jgi:glutathione S-transferase